MLHQSQNQLYFNKSTVIVPKASNLKTYTNLIILISLKSLSSSSLSVRHLPNKVYSQTYVQRPITTLVISFFNQIKGNAESSCVSFLHYV